MTWTYTDEYYKAYTRDTWNESVDAYDIIARNLDHFNEPLLRAANPRALDVVLDVASGLGEPAFTLAPRVKSVLAIDLSVRMVEKASALAKARGVENVEFKEMDAEDLKLADASFDLVTCRFGLQIVTDPVKTIREMHRVLKPGGRVAATVWGPGDRNPALHAMVGPMLEHAEPDETGYLPTPYEMGGPGELSTILAECGFASATEERVTRDWTFRDQDEYIRGVMQGTPLGHSFREEDEEVQKDVFTKLLRNLKQWERPGGLVMPAEAVVVHAVK